MPTRRRAERLPPEERRAAIIDATVPLLFEHGHRVTVRLIAEAAGVAEGTIFTVFRDKDALLEAAVAKAFDPTAALRELAAIDRSTPLRERLVAMVDVVARHLHRAFLLISALGLTGPPTEGPAAERRRRTDEAFLAAMTAVVAPDADALTVPPAELAHLLRLLTFSGTHPVISQGRPLSAEQIVDALLDGVRRRDDGPAQDRADHRRTDHHPTYYIPTGGT
ncbi:transcriptional regulator, TetR family [Pseudonocardia thermophila]|uniref:Transcriptional regulator, TetR family n=1 Tax=Pseudonocardia thermophila TaxID=1848 RepID=A0A1M6NQE1_PSETH|nr:TetR/AcrR family transcriptional regulator [Pseudonocardia thermophila]SHJ97792.1 transcriptional regulator, TetR family [Pseudonocardia thermophila]